MAGKRSRSSRSKGRQRRNTLASAPVPTAADPEVAAALKEVQRILDSPLSELMETEEERAAGSDEGAQPSKRSGFPR